MIPKGLMNVKTEDDTPENDSEESKEHQILQKLDDQEIEPIEEVVIQNIQFYKEKVNWLHSEQSKNN